jgi:hypothetical protein
MFNIQQTEKRTDTEETGMDKPLMALQAGRDGVPCASVAAPVRAPASLAAGSF